MASIGLNHEMAVGARFEARAKSNYQRSLIDRCAEVPFRQCCINQHIGAKAGDSLPIIGQHDSDILILPSVLNIFGPLSGACHHLVDVMRAGFEGGAKRYGTAYRERISKFQHANTA